VSGHHGDVVPLTGATYAEVMPPEMFADVTFQRCPDPGCGHPTMTVLHAGRALYVFHLTSDELSAVEIGAGRLLAGLDT